MWHQYLALSVCLLSCGCPTIRVHETQHILYHFWQNSTTFFWCSSFLCIQKLTILDEGFKHKDYLKKWRRLPLKTTLIIKMASKMKRTVKIRRCLPRHYFLFSFSSFSFSQLSTFLIEGMLGSKNLFCISWRERKKNLGVDTSSDPIGHFWAPQRPFGIWGQWASAPSTARLAFSSLPLQNEDYF